MDCSLKCNITVYFVITLLKILMWLWRASLTGENVTMFLLAIELTSDKRNIWQLLFYSFFLPWSCLFWLRETVSGSPTCTRPYYKICLWKKPILLGLALCKAIFLSVRYSMETLCELHSPSGKYMDEKIHGKGKRKFLDSKQYLSSAWLHPRTGNRSH